MFQSSSVEKHLRFMKAETEKQDTQKKKEENLLEMQLSCDPPGLNFNLCVSLLLIPKDTHTHTHTLAHTHTHDPCLASEFSSSEITGKYVKFLFEGQNLLSRRKGRPPCARGIKLIPAEGEKECAAMSIIPEGLERFADEGPSGRRPPERGYAEEGRKLKE